MFTVSVNIALGVNVTDIQVPKWIVRRIRANPGLEVGGVWTNALEVRVRGGRGIVFRVVHSQRVGAAEAKNLSADQGKSSTRLLVAAEALSRAARNELVHGDVSWLDRRTGSQHLVGPGLFVSQTIAPEDEPLQGASEPALPRLRGKAGVVAEVLLGWPVGHIVHLAELAERADVSKPLASRILGRLVALGAISAEGVAPHRHWIVSDANALFERWVEEGVGDGGEVSALYLWAANPEERYRKLQLLTDAGVKWALGAVAAANVYAPHLSVLPDPDLWVEAGEPIERIASLLGAEHVSKGGNVIVRQEDRDLPLVLAQEITGNTWRSGLRAVSPHRAAAEAMRVPGRGADVAEHLLGELRRQLPQRVG
jgi:hypothetical protein